VKPSTQSTSRRVPWRIAGLYVARRVVFFAFVWLFIVFVSFMPAALEKVLNAGGGAVGFRFDTTGYIEAVSSYLKGLILHGTLGTRGLYDRLISQTIAYSLPRTLALMLPALSLSLLLGVPLGLICSTRHRSRLRLVVRPVVYTALSVPDFLIALGAMALTIYLARAGFPILPVAGYGTYRYLIVPTLILTFLPTAALTRLAAAAFDRVLGRHYIRTARSKGCPEHRTLLRHAAKNALVEVLADMPKILALLLSNLVILEYLFSIPGSAYHLVRAIADHPRAGLGFFNFDPPMIAGHTLVLALVVLSIEGVVQLVAAGLDPRLRGEGQ